MKRKSTSGAGDWVGGSLVGVAATKMGSRYGSGEGSIESSPGRVNGWTE